MFVSKPAANPALAALRKRVAKMPSSPGVYRWMNADGDVLYVGKAKDLRARLRNYVAPDAGNQGAWKEALMRVASDVEVTVVRSDLEAFVLETNLIKQFRPKYNVLMKDDKNFVYVRITADAYPRIEVLRRMNDDDATYIGPKTSQYQVERTLEMLRTLYPFRTCKMSIVPKEGATGIPLDVVLKNKDRPTPCLDHHIGQCVAPCTGAVSPEEYRAQCIDPVIRFLRGDQKGVTEKLAAKMKELAANRKFETAAKLRDTLSYMQDLAEKQSVSDTSREDADVVGVAILSNRAQAVILRERDGKIIDDVSLELSCSAEQPGDVLGQILPQFFESTTDYPRLLVLPETFEGIEAFAEWLQDKAGRKVEIRVPERGKQSTVLKLAMHNASERAKQREAKWEAEHRMVEGALEELQQILDLPNKPHRIEGYDISHLGGTETVGSMSVVIDGKPANREYRHFTIRGLKTGEVDDYRSIREVLRRRLRYIVEDLKKDEGEWNARGITFGLPRKHEQVQIDALLPEHAALLRALSKDDAAAFHSLVARRDKDVVGVGVWRTYPKNVVVLSHPALIEEMRGTGLHRLLLRKIIRSVKKGKIYMTMSASLEQEFAAMGFQYLQSVPPFVQETLDHLNGQASDGEFIAMLYDVSKNKPDPSLLHTPDLLMIDGGKGQLGFAVDVLKEYGLQIPVIGLAKREEEIFVPGNPVPLHFAKESQGRYLLMRLRDEAHRFANRLREMKAKNTLLGQ